jgi:hypothetical protein
MLWMLSIIQSFKKNTTFRRVNYVSVSRWNLITCAGLNTETESSLEKLVL